MADDVDGVNAETLTSVNFLDLLPTEILTRILALPELHFIDVVNVGATCKRYHAKINDNELWKVKLLTRWPCLGQAADNAQPSLNWLHLCKELHQVLRTVRDLVSGLSAKCFHREEENYSDFHPLRELYLRREFNRAPMEDLLMRIVTGDQPHKNLTMKFYAESVLRYLRRIQLRQEWQDFFVLPIEQQNLLEGAILLERWYNTSNPPPQKSIRQQVAQIANQARGKLKMDHPCCHDNTEGVVEMTTDQCKEVLDAVNEVLYEELEFRSNSEDFHNKSNLFMSLVLTRKLGVPVTLCILYEAVVRRLGVVLRPVDFPCHFLLCWNYSSDGFKGSDTNLFIDAFNKGQVMAPEETQYLNLGMFDFRMEYLQPCTPKVVFRRMMLDITYINQRTSGQSHCNWDGMEFDTVLDPGDYDIITSSVGVFLRRKINYSESLEMLLKVRPTNDVHANNIRRMKDELEEAIEQEKQKDKPSLPPKRREENKDVTYAVGMVMRLKGVHYPCVICGWDPVCRVSWQEKFDLGMHHLPRAEDKQPFYDVLVKDSSIRYAAQENLEYIDVPVAISHPDVGKYFQEFTQTCYLPNEQLAQQYPDDTVITTRKAAELYAN